MSQAQAILEFWFGHPGDEDYGTSRKVWFSKNSEFDQEIQARFFSDYQQAASGELDSWKAAPQECLALVLLYDQFPRNMFRGTPQAFATDPQALMVARHAVIHRFDQTLPPVQRQFFYLPFEHSENLEHQRQAVELFRPLQDYPETKSSFDYAVRHYEIIERFGRFPHRNPILGRETTPEEAEFLKQRGSLF